MATVENAGKAIASPWPEALTSMASRSATGWSGLRRETDPPPDRKRAEPADGLF